MKGPIENVPKLLVSFPDQSASFVNGFEAGLIDQRMGSNETPIEVCVHIENEEIFRRLANYRSYIMDWCPSEVEGWSYITLNKVLATHKNKNPHGLRIVK